MKVFILGLDGATFNCLDPLMEEGALPNIKAMCSGGAYGPLTTVFPPVTAPAWLALATGLNPGKTGVFDYINKSVSDGHRMVPISSAYYENRAVWNYLNRRGYKVGIFNYPTLSPAPAVDGFAVSGMGGYSKDRWCFPEDLAPELTRVTSGYETSLNLRNPRYRRRIDLFFSDIDRIMTKQMAALRFLAQEKEWDFFWGVFSFTDWMQHVLWKYIDKSHPLHDARECITVQENYKNAWRKIDAFVGELLSMLPGDSVFIIVSDHGAGPIDSVFYPNAWLEKQGWLKRKRLGWKRFLVDNLNLFASGSDHKYVNTLLHIIRDKLLRIDSSLDLIDLDSSLAFSPEHNTMFGCVSLTQTGRSRRGFREHLAEEIRRLSNTVRGIDSVEVLFPEEIYSGPHVRLSPDIFFIVNNYRTTVEVDLAKEVYRSSPSINMRTGGHLLEGVFIAKGHNIRKNNLHDISVLDVAPTVLAIYNVGIPPDFDGRVMLESLKDEALQSLKILRNAETTETGTDVSGTGDLDEMKKMLKSLGYM